MGEAIRAGGLYRQTDGTWRDANGFVVPGPTAEEKKRVQAHEDALWEREEQLATQGGRVLVETAPRLPKRPETRFFDDAGADDFPVEGMVNFPPAQDAAFTLDLTADEQAQIDAIRAKAAERIQAEREEGEKALRERREEARKEGQAEAKARASGVKGIVGIPENTPTVTTSKGGK